MSFPSPPFSSPPSSFQTPEFLNKPLRLLLIWSSVFLFAFYVWSAAEARKNTSNRVVDWLPKGTEELETFYHRYYQHFPEGELLMVSWTGCEINDQHLDSIAARLVTPPDNNRPAYFERVLTTHSLFQELSGEPLELKPAEIRSRLAGWLIGRNQKDACLIALINPAEGNNRANAIEAVFATVEEMTGLPRSEIFVAGPTIDSVAIDEISKNAQKTLLPFFLLFCLVLLFCCLRNFFAALIVFAAAQMNEELGGTLLYWCGAHVDSISMLISSLIYVLTISGGVHLINYYRETLAEAELGNEKKVPLQTVKKAALPCALAVITTILGMGSLARSQMVPIRTFGIYASFALALGTLWLFLFVITILQQYPIRRWYRTGDSQISPAGISEKRGWQYLGLLVFRYRIAITLFAFFLMLVFAAGVKNLRTTVTFHGLLPESAKVIQDYNELEGKIGGLIPIEVVVHIPDAGNSEVTLLDQLYLLGALREVLGGVQGVDTVVSVLNFLPDLPSRTSGQMIQAARRSALRGILNRHQDRLREARFYDRTIPPETAQPTPTAESFPQDSPGTYWRMSLRVSSQAKVNYDHLISEIRTRLESVRAEAIFSKTVGVQFDVTGGVPLVRRAQAQLLHDLIDSFMTAFALIALTMILMLRSIFKGILAMVPNIFPCVVVFGFLGMLDIPVDMGSMMTASVAMGISVDGTLHFLTWFNIALKQGQDRQQAVLSAYRRCATALLQTTIICGFGMLIFGLSDFVPVARFAVLLCLLLIVSLIGDIIVLPAILFSPLGKLFELKKS
ncbi:MAG: MMPL family transporter [Planctomycetaceae bacterium]|jgi:predicted RND superfamily exporter protein|nr:MMPL family transporter [Planctomycetaceae bacterium]